MNKARIFCRPVRRVPRADVIQLDPDGRKRPQESGVDSLDCRRIIQRLIIYWAGPFGSAAWPRVRESPAEPLIQGV